MITVTCNGCFDGLHPGHLFYLGYCAARGDRLVVGINDDAYLRRKKREPHFTTAERSEMLLRLGCVSEVRVFTEDDPCDFLRGVQPQVHCTGGEYGPDCTEATLCRSLGIRLVLIPRLPHWSTTHLPDGFRTLMAQIIRNDSTANLASTN